MKAFHGDPQVKARYLSRVLAHQAADEIIHGTYWENGKGCAVGCTIHSGNHAGYETELGIPRALAHLEDDLFESLDDGHAKAWPVQFLEVIPVGADLSMVVPQFLYWLLADENDGVIRHVAAKRFPNMRDAVVGVADLFKRWLDGETIERDRWVAARRAAYAAYDAYAAAAYAAYAADAYAADAYAAYAADAHAAYAAAAYAADVADVADVADTRQGTRLQSRIRQSEKLLELLRAAPVAELTEAK